MRAARQPSPMPSRSLLLLLALFVGASASACSRGRSGRTSDQATIEGVLGARRSGSSAGGAPGDTAVWESLFDGSTLAGWHGFKTPGKAPTGWQALDGTLVRVTAAEDLVTDRSFANFELSLEWQITEGGNSGVLYRIDPTADVTYESGPEMQVLDDAGHADGSSRLTSAGSVFGLYPSPPGVVKGPGVWNSARVVARGPHVEHWLNGVRVVTYELWSPDWERRVKESKFAAWQGYGRAQRGFIGLQDHGDRVAYRNIRIRELR